MPVVPLPAAPTRRVHVASLAAVCALVLVALGGGPGAGPPAAGGTAPAARVVTAPGEGPLAPSTVVQAALAGPAAGSVPEEGPEAEGPAHPGALAPRAVPSSAQTPDPAHSGAPGRDTAPVTRPPSGAVEPDPARVPDVVTGTIERAYAEIGDIAAGVTQQSGATAAEEGDAPGLFTWVRTDEGLSIRVPTAPLRHIPDGARVRVELGDQVVVQELGGGPHADEQVGYEVQAAQVLSTPSVPEEPVLAAAAAHQVTVAMVAPAGMSPDGTSVATVKNTVAGGVSAFWSEQTGGAVAFDVVAAYDWRTTSSTCSQSFSLWDEVAQGIGWQPGAGKHLLLYLPKTGGPPDCYSGLGTVGSGASSGGKAYVRSTSTSIIAHELGHNMGLGHSNGLLCAGSSDGLFASGWSNGCQPKGYRDYYDVMGISWSNLGTLSTVHASALGALTTTSRTDVVAPTRAVLAPVSGQSGMRTLKLVDGSTTYWVEYRPASGRDTWLTSNSVGLVGGIVVRRSDPSDSRGSLVLDGSPSSTVNTSDWNLPVATGSTLSVASGRFTVRVENVATDSAQVAVAVDGQWPAAGPPIQVTYPTAGQRVAAGTVRIAGTATAYEGTLLYEVTGTSDAVVASGFTNAGANGEMAPFSLDVVLSAGSYTVAAWSPDESDGEGSLGPRPFEVRRSFTVG